MQQERCLDPKPSALNPKPKIRHISDRVIKPAVPLSFCPSVYLSIKSLASRLNAPHLPCLTPSVSLCQPVYICLPMYAQGTKYIAVSADPRYTCASSITHTTTPSPPKKNPAPPLLSLSLPHPNARMYCVYVC